MLTDAQIARYQAQGFLIVENVIPPDEVERLKQRTADIAEGRVPFPEQHLELEPTANGHRSLETVRKLDGCAEYDPVFLEHARNDVILDMVEDLIGPDVKLFESQLFMKPPGGVEKPYHQDSAYFSIEPMALVTCWSALDDVSVENGGMWVIPGSHRRGVVDHAAPWKVGDRVDMQIPVTASDRAAEVPMVMPAGSCSFHHSLLMHSSRPNRTNRSRRGLAVHYMTSRSRWTDPDRPAPGYRLLRGREFPGCV
jgi:phytanoyl-CoA hydroxylase